MAHGGSALNKESAATDGASFAALDWRQGAIIVTGAAGFIGSWVASAIVARGGRVVGIDNFDPFYPRERKQANAGRVVNAAREGAGSFELVEADLCDQSRIADVFVRAKPAGVIHLAAKAGVRPSIADPSGYMRANVVGTSVVLEESRRVGASRVLVASSSSVYGNAPSVPFHESMDVNEPISPYAASKRACELICSTHHHLTKQPVACLRFFTVYGPGQRPDLAIQSFLTRISRGETIRMFGDGSNSRDYTYIDDIVRGVLAAYERVTSFGHRVWNLGGSHPVTLREMIETIERIVGRKAIIERVPMQPGDVERTYADITRSGEELEYAPRIGFEDGVRMQWEWERNR